MWLIIGGVAIFVALLMFVLARSISNADTRQKEWEDTGPHPSIYAETHGRLKAVRPPKVENEPGLQQMYSSQSQQELQALNPQHQQHNHAPHSNPSHHNDFGGGHHSDFGGSQHSSFGGGHH